MQPLAVYRAWAISALEHNLASAGHIVATTDPRAMTTFRDGGDGWTPLEVLAHLRDFEAVFHERALLTLSEDLPALPFPNPDELARDRHYNSQPIDEVLATWRETRAAFLATLAAIPDEATWERAGHHPTRGRFTLNDALFLAVWHDSNHLDQILRTLALREQ